MTNDYHEATAVAAYIIDERVETLVACAYRLHATLGNGPMFDHVFEQILLDHPPTVAVQVESRFYESIRTQTRPSRDEPTNPAWNLD